VDGNMMDTQECDPGEPRASDHLDTSPPEPVAIIGIGCRLPGRADSPAAFWTNLLNGIDAITDVPVDRWNADAFYDPEPGKPGKSHARRGGFVEGIDQFDPHFFGISPREAARMDPQQRMLLETAWEAVEDAGLVPARLAGERVATFVGISSWDYSILQTSFRDRGVIDAYSNTGGSLSIAANRISYCFDFKGPSAAVDTACSSALVALHLACRSIWADGCPLALVGGANALLAPDWFVGFSRMGMLSPDGRCHAFDVRANGFVRAEGAGVVVLKPLSRAVADGDRIYALIRGTAVNQDGRTPGMTVPDGQAQEELLREACRNAGVLPSQIRYVETHGTGTPVGDPIEAGALGRVLGVGRPANRPVIIGSVKTNVGHLEAGSGIAGLIKTALALYHGRIPGNLHFERPNPAIDFAALRLRVPVTAEPWPDGDGPPLAGVNSFGFGGTNAHAVLQGIAPLAASRRNPLADRLPTLVPVSARSPEALRDAADALAEFVVSDVSLHDVAWNAAVRRTHHEHRLAVVAGSKEELTETLRSAAVTGRAGQPRVAFVCSGQGPQWWAMGRQLLDREPVFCEVIERCDAIIRRLGPWSLLEELTADEPLSRMAVTAISQPAIFALQVGLAAVWRSWGVVPQALVGHSVGEVAAAHLAGVFDLEDAVTVIYHRGRCMELAPSRGRMLAAGIAPDEARRLIAPHGERVSLAAMNGPASVTLSGEPGPLEAIAKELEARGVFHRFLQVQYAFHSAQMDPIRDELIRSLAGIAPGTAALPLFSTVTGERVRGPELGPDYWWQNVRRTVRFADGVGKLIDLGCDTVVELSPHPVLTAAVGECYRHRGKTVTALPSLRRQEDERGTMLRSLGVLHVRGHAVEWTGVISGPRPFVRLPSYPWQCQRCWFESDESRHTRLTAPAHPLLGAAIGGPRAAWERRLDLALFPDLADHRVQHAAILPATAYVEIAAAAAREVSGTTAVRLEDARLLNPCFLSRDTAVRLHTTFRPEDGTVEIDSRPVGTDATAWTPHFRAVVRPRAEDPAERFDPEAVRDRCPRAFSGADCYAYFANLGLDYGPRFRGIERCWQGDREALGLVAIPDASADERSLFPPALLDACFQMVIPADAEFPGGVGGLYLPVEFEAIQLYRQPGQRVWSHARLREKTTRATVADLDVHDESGDLVARVRGLRSQRVAGTGSDESPDGLLYAYEWQPRPLPVPSSPEHGHWLVFADRGGVGAALAERLQAAGGTCTVVHTGGDIPGLVGAHAAGCRGIVHLWALDAPSGEFRTADLAAAQDVTLLSTTQLVQAWETAGGPLVPLVLATRGAQAVGNEPVAVAQSPLIGLGRVVVNEYPGLRCKLVDLDPASDAIEPLFAELFAADDEDEVVWRGPDRFAHRFVPSAGRGEPETGDGSYRLTLRQPGSLDALALQATDRSPPGPGQVEIEVVAAGMNFSDVMKALGIYPGLPDGPVPLGAECSGRVVAVGEDVTDFAIGDEVFGVAPAAFASHVVTRAEFMVRKPPHLTFEQAAALPIAFLTAAHALDDLARLAAGERVLIHSASGGVGLAAVQIARRTGAEVFATAGTPEKREFLAELAVRYVFDSRTLAFADEILERTGGRGVDVILNSLAGEAIARGLDCLAEYGRFLEIGKRDIYANTHLGLRPFRKNLSFFAIDLDRMMRDRPAVLGGLLRKLAAEFADNRLSPLPQKVFPVADVAAAFRCLQAGKHVGKVVVSMRERPAMVERGDDPPTFRADGTYLVTGGLGGFGLAVARWLAERGAGSIVLVSRRGGATPELGARVTVMPADVSREEDVARVLAAIARDLPPLRGIFHAAMVLEDCLLLNLDADRFRRVLAPKVQGAWNLHSQTRGRPLDCFVLFSSLSSVFGHAGQGNYAAANAFLDSLAWHRRANGLPTLAVNWGHLGGVGYLAERPELGERLARQGVLSFPVRQALDVLGRALRRRAVQLSVMQVDWAKWRGLGVTGRVSPRFAHLMPQANGEAPGGTSTRDAILAASPESRRDVLEARLREKVGRVLGTPADQLDADVALLRLGVDSLMAVELLNWAEAELRVSLPVVELMRSPGLSNLAAALLERMADRPATAMPTATPADEPSPTFPLSHGQRGLWLLHQTDRDSPALNLAFCSRIRSPLDVAAFHRAVQALADRHPALRTTFEEENGEPMQRVHGRVAVALDVVDASTWDEAELRSRLAAETVRPFDLKRGPILRMHLFARAPDDHVFLLTVHHVAGDFWSLVILLDEMRTLYPAARDGTPAALPASSGTYRDLVRWQADRLAGPDGERLWDWWRQQLAGVPTVLDLPTDRPRPPRFTRRGASVPCQLDATLTARLKDLAAAEGATLFAVLLAGFQALIGRYAGRDEFLVGSPFAGRGRREFEGVVGYFVNVLPLRADLSGDPSFRKLARRASSTVLGAFEHQDFPFALLVERLNPERDPARPPLVQVTFAVQKAHRPGESGASRFLLPGSEFRLDVGGLQTEPYPIGQRVCQADVELVLEERDGTVEGILGHNADLFAPETMARFVGHLRTLLDAATAEPDKPLSRLPWLTAAEREQVLFGWNQTAAEFPRGVRLHELFERQTQETPDAIAVRRGNRMLSYRELDDHAERIARGIDRGSLVPVCLERSPELIATILGVLKAGAAYVPLDPDSPPARLAAIAEEVGAAASGDLAYVIFTSGSTGGPKGVMVEHAAVCNTIQWRWRDLPLQAGDRVLLSLPAFFDASVTAIFPTLASGAELVLAESGEERDPALLLNRIAADGVTVLQTMPGVLRLLLDEPGFAQSTRTVRRVICGGEPMPPDLPARLRQHSGAELVNIYGPTEAAVEATWWRCGAETDSVPIGRPVANARVYVLDANRQPVPVGVPGELCVGGAGLARGYLHDQALTAERFVPDPFVLGGRLFRTGDSGRWRADGTLEFLGRLDRQVKLRGYRIEPAEVEAALAAEPGVRECAVTLLADAGEPRLAAYVVPRNGAISFDQLRRGLERKLPRYAVPASFAVLSELPRTAGGKIDFRALPAPNGHHPVSSSVAPRSPLEEFLAELWRELLGVPHVGVEDHFFESGGSSLQAVRLTAHVREKLGEPVHVAAVFESPTVAGLADRLANLHPAAVERVFGPVRNGNGKHSPSSGLLVLLQPTGTQPPLFLVHPPGGIVACYQTLASHLGRERPVYGVRSRGTYGEESLPATLEAMAAEYVAAIRAVQPVGPYFLGGWSLGGVAAFEVARQLTAAGETVGLLAMLDTTLPFGRVNELYLDGIDRSGREYGFDVTLEELAALAPDEQLPYLWEHVRRLGLVAEDAAPELVRQTLDDLKRLFHHHVRLAGEYVLRPYPGQVTLFRPSNGPVAPPEDRGWGRVAAAVEVRSVPGQHHSMVKEPHVRALADALRECLPRTSDSPHRLLIATPAADRLK
jgi:amino acid adenylation domain-containing protein